MTCQSSSCFSVGSLPQVDCERKGLFIWARLTGLARFSRSHLASKSFVKFAMCSYERAGSLGSRDLGKWSDLGKRSGKFAL